MAREVQRHGSSTLVLCRLCSARLGRFYVEAVPGHGRVLFDRSNRQRIGDAGVPVSALERDEFAARTGVDRSRVPIRRPNSGTSVVKFEDFEGRYYERVVCRGCGRNERVRTTDIGESERGVLYL
jgi:hypothetical protein